MTQNKGRARQNEPGDQTDDIADAPVAPTEGRGGLIPPMVWVVALIAIAAILTFAFSR